MVLAKSRLLGIQFSMVFQGDLFSRLARSSNEVAAEMSTSLEDMGYKLWQPTESNQVLVVLPSALVQELQKVFDIFVWKHFNDGWQVARFVTSWTTELLEVRGLCAILGAWLDASRLLLEVF